MGVIPGIKEQNVNTLVPMLGQEVDWKNYANDQRVVERIRREIVPLLENLRSRKRPLNEEWAKFFKVWTLQHEWQGYEGRSNIYVPAGRKGIETITAQLVSGTFTSEDSFSVASTSAEYDGVAQDVQEAAKVRIDQMRVRSYAERFYRQMVITGNAPVKMYYDKRIIKTVKRNRGANGLRGLIDMNSEHVKYDGPVFRTIDAGNLYVFPEDAEDPMDVEIWAEDTGASISDLMIRAEKGTYNKDAVEAVMKGCQNPDKQRVTEDRLEQQMISSPASVGVPGWAPVDVTEVYLDFDPDAPSRFEEKNPVPFLVTVTHSGEVLRAIRNPFWHQQSPYLIGRTGTVTGRFWGTGYVEAIRMLQVLLNDQTNQGMDASTYALNPAFAVDPNAVLGVLKPMEPGVQWLVNDVNNCIRSFTPDASVITSMSVLTTHTMSWLQDFIGSPPVLQGGSAPGRAFRTATGINTAAQNARMPLQEVIRAAEEDVWEPMLQRIWWLDQQFASRDFMFWNYEGKRLRKAKRVPVEALAGDYAFKWMASTQSDNKNVKGSQIMQLLQILSQPAVVQLLREKQVRVNPAPLVRRLYQEVFGFRDVDQVLIDEAMAGMAPPARPTPEVSTTPEMVPGVPDLAGAGMQDLPPELAGGDEFQGVRMNADLLAGLEGLNNSPDELA